ncbi:TrbI/VirB10 family protein [Pontixanthobacter sp. CEM42]|uniref:TrbI/VirB10 family protein n=1 Tax=Pontixanthobacter sp. CEM42 TaxID=2792077 RepID=UPI001FD8228F|nr:TrbI/VirB10 family protein [Pontixanthobacter sp. CEM42]
MPSPEASGSANDALPVVANKATSNLGAWAFGILLVVGGIWLFTAMSANRAEMNAPPGTIKSQATGGRISAPPALAIPQSLLAASELEDRPVRLRRLEPIAALPAVSAAAPPPVNYPRVQSPVFAPPTAPPPVYQPERPSVVFDSAFQTNDGQSAQAEGAARNRVKAERFVRPSQTIPQGTVIPAVLETALDSTRPGAARALVQRDIYSFDGTRILIQRGSRLYGEYDSGLAAGQNRALIQWTRLIRPDGVTIALDSPSSDPLGRAGVKGKVDSKFLQRFGGAILQSVLDIGVGLATQEVGSGVVVALPGSTQNVQIQNGNQVQRTLKVKHGTSVSVFVARDLDFSTVDF